jgi:predicted nucleic-acid-binding protein
MHITMETPEETEAFNEVEKRSKIKQEILNNPSREAKLIAEVTVLTELVRVLTDRVNELEKK